MAARKTQALSLLEGILDETANEAEAAREALEAEIRRKEEEARAAAEAAEAERRAEIARRLREEEERQTAAADRRTAALEAIRVEELKAKGLWKEPEPEPVPVAAPAPVQAAAPPVEEKSRGGIFAAAAAILILGGGAAGGYMYMTQEFIDSTTSFASVQPSVVALADAQSIVAFTAIPDPIILQPEAAPEPTRRRSSTSGGSGTRERESEGPRIRLGGNLSGD